LSSSPAPTSQPAPWAASLVSERHSPGSKRPPPDLDKLASTKNAPN
jgi:hypothetical protein